DGSKLVGGFAVALALLSVLAVISIRGTVRVEAQSAEVEESGRLATVVSDFARRVDDARARVMQYALSEVDGDLHLAQESLVGLRNATAALRSLPADNAE